MRTAPGRNSRKSPNCFAPSSDNEADTGDVAARPVEAGDEIFPDRVAPGCEDDWYRRGCGFGRNCRQRVVRSDHCHLTAYQIGCEVGESIILVVRPAIFDRHILVFDVPGFADALPECGHETCSIGRRRAAEKPNHRHSRLLCARPERPGRRRAAEKRDECATLHVWMAPAWQEIIWRAAQRSLAVMCPACWCSPGGLLALMGSANRVLIIRTGSMSR